MKERTAKLLANAFLDALEAIGVSAAELSEVILCVRFPPKYKKLGQEIPREWFKQRLRAVPEPTKAERNKALALIEAFKKAPQQLRPFLKKVSVELPRARSGPHRKLAADLEISACAKIASLRGDYSNREAVQQVARIFKVSERTMYRILKKHRPKKARRNMVQENGPTDA